MSFRLLLLQHIGVDCLCCTLSTIIICYSALHHCRHSDSGEGQECPHKFCLSKEEADMWEAGTGNNNKRRFEVVRRTFTNESFRDLFHLR